MILRNVNGHKTEYTTSGKCFLKLKGSRGTANR